MRAYVNFMLEGFGFSDYIDFKMSSIGHILNLSFGCVYTKLLGIFAVSFYWIATKLGITSSFLMAYLIMIMFEWSTGIIASFKAGELHSSRKLGRMFLKIAVYAIPLYIFNTFQEEVNFPVIAGYELDFFVWLYWTTIMVVIWQLFVSILENLDNMHFKFAKVLLTIVNNKFYKKFNLKEDANEIKENSNSISVK